MPLSVHSALSWGILLLGGAHASPGRHDAGEYPGTFQSPHARSRPRFRYWLPDASVDGEVLAGDIKSVGRIGAGGIEFLAFYNYGGGFGSQPKGADWSTYGFGTPAYRDLLVDALRAHKEAGLYMDIAIGPNQGQGVPASPDEEGLQWDLIPYTAAVPSSGNFDGGVPGWKDGELLGVVSARVLSQLNESRTTQGFEGPSTITWTEYTIDHSSLVDITSEVNNSTGWLTKSFDSSGKGGDYRIFSFYQRLSGNLNVHFDNDRRETIFDYGSFEVDHNSARGAQAVINHWEKNIVDDEVLGLIKAAGNYMWEDSIEVISNTTWTPSLPQKFQERFGYSLIPYLPLLAWGHNNIGVQSGNPGDFKVILNTAYEGAGYINDFRVILTEGYLEYLQTLRDWANNRLGIQFSTQPSYGFPQDMAVSIPIPDAPECESLTFVDKTDAYRQFTGAAHLTGKNVISNELGAVALKAYRYLNRELIWSASRALAGGVNQFVIHGQSFTGEYYNTTWPGYTAFTWLFSELFMNKQPSWDNGLQDVLDYLARLQYTQRHGQPNVDVAILNKQSASNMHFQFPTIYQAEDLQSEGWTYSYLTDLNLDLPQAIVQHGILAPKGPSWKAFVIDSSGNLTVEAVDRVRRLAREGLPVIISGSPGYYPTKSGCSRGRLERAITALRQEANVHSVAEGQVAAKLRDLGLRPQITTSNANWYSTWRRDDTDASGTDYAFFFNDGPASSGNVTVITTKKPFILDPWTGQRSEVAHYTVDPKAGVVTIPLNLAADQTMILSFENAKHGCHVNSASSGIASVKSSSKLNLHVSSSGSGSVTLSSGKKISISSKAPSKFALKDWMLTVSHWTAPSNLYDVQAIAVKSNTTHALTSNLPSWSEIPGLEDTSGVGYYTTSFHWPSSKSKGAYISFPPVDHALRVYINGQRVPTLNYHNPVKDITSFLRPGKNEVLAVVPSTMWNYLRTLTDELRQHGEELFLLKQFKRMLPPIDHGIRGVVEITPFEKVEVRC